MSLGVALILSVLLLILNAFFVATEFAIMAAKRHRLEERAGEGSRAARAALASNRQMTVMLAGSQMGITLATLGLGALAKPAVAELLKPLMKGIGLPTSVAYVISTIIAVAFVVFLHMVVGEMAPKSWAISHPETAALWLAIPFRAFTWVLKPVLLALNELSNWLLRRIKVDPVESVGETHGPADLQLLLAQSHEHGVLPDEEHQLLTGALRLEQGRLKDVVIPLSEAVTVPANGTLEDVEDISRETGRSRLLVVDGEEITGLVHIRDAVRQTADGVLTTPLAEIQQDVVRLSGDLQLIDAATHMRQERAQLALVTDGDKVTGLTGLEDILEQILGQFDDETDNDSDLESQEARA